MNRISFVEKIGILWKESISSYWLPLVLILLLGFAYLLLLTNPRNKKRNQRIYIGFSFGVLILLLLIYHPSLSKFFDYFMNHVFIAILFPNPALYFFMIVITNIIVWISIFNEKTSNIIKRVNVVIYIILNYLLALTLNVIDKAKLDIFEESVLFTNKKAAALIQCSSTIFIFWILFLIIYKVILTYVRKDNKEKVRKLVVTKKKLPENYQPVEPPVFLSSNKKPKVEEIKEEVKDIERLLTVEDYRLLRRVLKEEKEKEKQEEKEKERQQKEKTKKIEKEKIAEMKLQEKIREEEKFTELEMLYRSIK